MVDILATSEIDRLSLLVSAAVLLEVLVSALVLGLV